MVLTGKENDYTGNTTVKEGELRISSGVSLGTGKLTVEKDAILSGVTTTTGALGNSAIVINGTLQVGLTATSTSGVMNFGQKPVTFNKGSMLILGIGKPATATNTGGTSLQDMTRITMNGTVRLNLKEGVNWQIGDSVVLWNTRYSMGNPILENYVVDAEKGLYWDDSQLRKGILKVTDVVPTAIESIAINSNTIVNASVYNLIGHKVAEIKTAYSDIRNALEEKGVGFGIYIVNYGKKSEKIIIK